ncbi:MAG: 2-hydroxyacid dehydrogenase [Oscillospiraceae bacterium]|nr:2-hydroxyacid dehydrogenase [Oscillospiraceae bacterium]
METVAFFDTKSYDKVWFDRLKHRHGIDLKYYDNRLNRDTAIMASGCRAVVAFVTDQIDAPTIDMLRRVGVEAVSLRSAGYNHVDLRYAEGKLRIFRVPAYAPNAVAEHAMALLLCLNRKVHRAYNRVREYNFSLKGLIGFDLKGKTVGVVGTGKIGLAFIDICLGFGMKVLACDPQPAWGRGVEYVSFPDLCRRSDVISLHCPLTRDSYHLISRHALRIMKEGVVILNTSRGALIDAEALLDAIKHGKVSAAGLDVYEEESDFFYEDVSENVIRDDKLKLLLATPNVLVTSHQGFLTDEALREIAAVTLQNLADYFAGRAVENEVFAQGRAKAL